jgi:hypothetical protein
MSNDSEKDGILRQLDQINAQILQVQPAAETGCCTLRTRGWSEQKSGVTKEACDKMASPGITAEWKAGTC